MVGVSGPVGVGSEVFFGVLARAVCLLAWARGSADVALGVQRLFRGHREGLGLLYGLGGRKGSSNQRLRTVGLLGFVAQPSLHRISSRLALPCYGGSAVRQRRLCRRGDGEPAGKPAVPVRFFTLRLWRKIGTVSGRLWSACVGIDRTYHVFRMPERSRRSGAVGAMD